MLDILSRQPEVKKAASATTQKAIEKSRMTAWLADRVERARKGVATEFVTLNPVLAELLLAGNADNRKISETYVENYRRDMVAGRWQLNGEPIVIASDGSLNDGQHRCLAVIAGNVAIQVVMVFGVARESRFTVDQGRARTSGDYLGMNGHVDTNVLATVSSYIWQWKEKGRISQGQQDRPTKSEVLLTADHYRDINDSILVAGKKGVNLVGGKSVVAFCHWAICRKGHESDATAFIRQLIEGDNLEKRNPILTARNRLAGAERLKPNEKVELIFRAWNAHIRRERPVSFQVLNAALPKLVGR